MRPANGRIKTEEETPHEAVLNYLIRQLKTLRGTQDPAVAIEAARFEIRLIEEQQRSRALRSKGATHDSAAE